MLWSVSKHIKQHVNNCVCKGLAIQCKVKKLECITHIIHYTPISKMFKVFKICKKHDTNLWNIAICKVLFSPLVTKSHIVVVYDVVT
jgi:hypothetical protein